MRHLVHRAACFVGLAALCGISLTAQMRVVGKLGRGQVAGRDVIVHVSVAVPPGADVNQAVGEALRRQNARPLASAEYTTTGLVWDEFADGNPSNNYVIQNYNSAGDPTGAGESALVNTQITWRGAPGSSFDIAYGGTTTRCPSLVAECPGPQQFDGKNDVGWADLGKIHPFFGGTLAVTWFDDQIDEADMAMNTRVNWSTSGSGSAIDLETVILHENGHVGGLGHSLDTTAIMYASYQGVRRSLAQDDVDGIVALYPGANSCTVDEASETTCDDSIDNDCDGFVDAGDLNCAGPCTITEDPEASCSDGVDNDCDLLTDGADPDCAPTCSVTEIPEVSCTDSNDNDCDGLIDAADSDCSGGGCSLAAVGDFCSDDSDCCSNKCRGKAGNKTCKP